MPYSAVSSEAVYPMLFHGLGLSYSLVFDSYKINCISESIYKRFCQ